MLERRAGAPPPGWLLPGVAEAVRHTGQVRGGRPWSGLPGTRRFGRLALVAAAALVLLALAAGVLVAARLILPPPQPTPRAIVAVPGPSASAALATPEPTEEPTDQVRPPATAAPPAFAPDTIAVVTTAGDALRVRSKPGVAADSKKLSPLLKQGSRMLVVDGPVTADGYDWYEVQADNDLFGWVAAGKGSEDWIASAEPNCADDLDESAVRTVVPIDFLICYGDAPVSVKVHWSSMEDGGDIEGAPACPYTGDRVRCSAHPKWLFEPRGYTFVTDGASPDLLAAAHGSVLDDLRAVPEPSQMTLTIAMDAPQARDCRIVDDRGRDLISRHEAVTRCRLTFVVHEVARQDANLLPGLNTITRVTSRDLPMRTEPGLRKGLLTEILQPGDQVYVDAGPVLVDGVDWYAVMKSHGYGAYGWVPASVGGSASTSPVPIRCPLMQDWAAFMQLQPTERLACFGDQAQVVDAWMYGATAREPYASLGCGAYSISPDITPITECDSTPEWLTAETGLVMRGDVDAELPVTFEPGTLTRRAFPSSPTRMKVGGSFGHVDSDTCRVVDKVTGEDLYPPAAAHIFCRAVFVVDSLEPLPQ